MAIAKKALVWGMFAAGGTLTAFVFPVLIALFVLVSSGSIPQGLSYDSAREFAGSWMGKLALFSILIPALWHAAHRLRVIFHDIGVRADGIIASGLYLLATVGSVLLVLLLMRID